MIPDHISKLCRFSPKADIEILVNDSQRFYCRVGGLELRFVLSTDQGWVFDEVVGPCRIHIEQMDTNYYWVGIMLPQDQGMLHVDIGAKRAPVRMTGWTEHYETP